jgi:glycosyltransferase involved in cell wall biosynthesis
MPRFSLVIPTLNRPDTLRHSLATLVRQSYDDYEIVVQNNGGDPATQAVIQEFDNPRIRHYSSPSILSMPDNWEAALVNARGDFITFIGDDDGLFIDACGLASQVVDQSGVEVVSWIPYSYLWPRCPLTEQKNYIYAVVDYDFHATILSAEKELEKFYGFTIDFRQLPTIYCAFVSRRVIDQAIKSIGRYFVGIQPDVTSGIVNAAQVSHFARLSRPLSIAGLSHHSTGTRFARNEMTEDLLQRDFGTIKFDDRLVASHSMQITIANDMLRAHDLLFRDRPTIKLDFTRLIERTAADINVAPALYDETIKAIEALAALHKIGTHDLAIPPRFEESPTAQFGASMIGASTVKFVIDGNAVSLSTIADAVKFMEQLNSHPDGSEIEIKKPQGNYVLTIPVGHTVTFGFFGDGIICLLDGWSEPEKWGTWSIGKRAILRFFARAKSDSPLRINLKFRCFIAQKHHKLKIACHVRGQDICAWILTTSYSSERTLTIPTDVIGQDGLVELEFIISNPQSPAALGLSSDARTLGIGIEALRVEA